MTETAPIRPVLVAAGLLILLLAGCETPSINLATDEPIKVEIDVRLDVYQHGGEMVESDATTRPVSEETADAMRDRKNRLAQIQTMKNNRIVGEARNGLIAILENPGGEYGDYVREVVALENQDRLEVMQRAAEEENLPLPQIQARQAEVNRTRAFAGEYIEIQLPDGGTWQWVQKEG